MTITIPDWLVQAVAAYPVAGVCLWLLVGRRDRRDALLGFLLAWPLVLWVIATAALSARGWFVNWRPVDRMGDEVTFHSRRRVRGSRWALGWGEYRTTSGWGSRWVEVGPVIVGRKRASLALSEKPPPEERTKPRDGMSYQWGNGWKDG